AQHDGQAWSLSELTPGTTYLAKATVAGIPTRPVEFSTEEMLQIPNGDMDGELTPVDGASHWDNWQFPSPWGTNNPMTSSQGINAAYCRVSGTVQTNDAHSGKAALVRTVGWGSGNTNVGTSWSIVKYIDTGLLHIGASRKADQRGQDCDSYGMPWSSRPASVSFWYKYAPVNGADYAEVEVWLKDRSGNVIASAVRHLTASDVYKQVPVELNYIAGAEKAATLYVKFVSTANGDCLNKNSLKFGSPHLGSQLYVDDITLNY
ncbi:MAG: PCMD domain-containing protein, partial [Muribaculaceae bacterium]|nr:PCMD domain-containing protein [Muribaculaceae bacterium]